ncbi:MAG: hypothetical protein ABSF83_11965 [Nitrososphaerales archaeon]
MLVVFLVFSATVLVFESFTNYSLLFKQVDQQDAQNRVTDAEISNLAFGEQMSSSQTETLVSDANLGGTHSLLPISNMNFSNSMSGWVFSRDYKIVRDNGTVKNTFENILPGGTVFTMSVTNNDNGGSCVLTSTSPSCITKVTLLLDAAFTPLMLPLPPPPSASWSVTNTTNSITWTAVGLNSGIPAGAAPVLFNWTAIAPSVPRSYYQTATVTWTTTTSTGIPINDEGSASFVTNVVTGGPGETTQPQKCSPPNVWNICAEPLSVIPGGVAGGFDPVSNAVGSESGPGSVYLDFEPTYNGQTLTNGQQLTAVMNFTSAFTVDAGQAAALQAGAADAVNFGYSLDQVISPPNPLILIDVYLVQLNPATGAVEDAIQVPNTSPVVPTAVNDFNSSGWITCGPNSVACPEPYFNPVTLAAQQDKPVWSWASSTLYELEVSVTASMPGATPPSSNYPSSLLMHFDDIGLTLHDNAAAFYVDDASASQSCVNPSPPPATVSCGVQQLDFPLPIDPSQVQSIQLTTNLDTSASSNESVTGYVFLGDVSRGTTTPVWVEVGQLEFSSSATLTFNIPAATASNFIDQSGNICGNPGSSGLCVRVYAISDGSPQTAFQLTATASAAVQTYQQNVVTMNALNNSTFPVAFTTVYVSGPDGVSNYYLTSACSAVPGLAPSPPPSPCYVNQGQTLSLQLPFAWRIDQTYMATIVTNKGLSFSESFVSP